MRILVLVACAPLAACELVFPLTPPDAPADPCPPEIIHDEDGDGIDDSCDNCLGLSNPGQENILDLGADAVGDACDPSPTTGGDEMTLAITFADLKENVLWQPLTTNNGWQFDGESLQFQPTDDNPSELLAKRPQPRPPFTLDFAVTFQQPIEAGTQIEILADAASDQTDANRFGVLCALEESNGDDVILTSYPVQTPVNGNSTPLGTIAGQTRYRVRMRYDTDRITCIASADGSTSEVISQLPVTTPPIGKELLVRGTHSAVRLEYLIVYTTN